MPVPEWGANCQTMHHDLIKRKLQHEELSHDEAARLLMVKKDQERPLDTCTMSLVWSCHLIWPHMHGRLSARWKVVLANSQSHSPSLRMPHESQLACSQFFFHGSQTHAISRVRASGITLTLGSGLAL